MGTLILIGYIAVILFLINTLICSKNKKLIWTINNKRYEVLDDKYYNTQFTFAVITAFLIIAFGFFNYFVMKDISYYTIITIVLFFGMNFLLSFCARKKGYFKINDILDDNYGKQP